MGEGTAQAEKFQLQGSEVWQEKPASPSPVPSSTPSPSLNPRSTGEAIQDNSQVNAVTVLTLLDKLVNMLDAVQENQNTMEQRQISLEGSVKGIQNDLTKLSKYQASTSNTVSKLLEKTRKVSAHTRAVKDRMERQCAQVKQLENNHAQLLRRNHFKVLIFQVSGPCSSTCHQLGCISMHDLSWPGSHRHLYICPACQGSHTQGIVLSASSGGVYVKSALRSGNFPGHLQPKPKAGATGLVG